MPEVIVAREIIEDWIRRVDDAWRSGEIRVLEADMHRVLSGMRVRKAAVERVRITENHSHSDRMPAEIEEFNAMTLGETYDWVEEIPDFSEADIDADGKLQVFEGKHGFHDGEGKFVERPLLSLVPTYLGTFEAALSLKARFFGFGALATHGHV